MKNKLFRRADVAVMLLVALIALLLFFLVTPQKEASCVTVRCRGEVLDTFFLDEGERTLSYALPEGDVVLSVTPNGVSILSSPCKGQNCVHTGAVSQAGEAVICLPLGFTVTLSGSGAFDGITG